MKSKPTLEEWLRVIEYVQRVQVGEFMNYERVFIERRSYDGSEDVWAITNGLSVLNEHGTWEYEPMPSNRDDAFYARCRFTFRQALLLTKMI